MSYRSSPSTSKARAGPELGDLPFLASWTASARSDQDVPRPLNNRAVSRPTLASLRSRTTDTPALAPHPDPLPAAAVAISRAAIFGTLPRAAASPDAATPPTPIHGSSRAGSYSAGRSAMERSRTFPAARPQYPCALQPSNRGVLSLRQRLCHPERPRLEPVTLKPLQAPPGVRAEVTLLLATTPHPAPG